MGILRYLPIAYIIHFLDLKFCFCCRWVPDFSLSKASQAFRYIEEYAANLINQPWRQEYRSIRQARSLSQSGWNIFLVFLLISRSVADPDPSDPYVFGPPGSGSVSQRSGSGSFYHQAKIVRNTLIPTVF
jgi:hypothetical protein